MGNTFARNSQERSRANRVLRHDPRIGDLERAKVRDVSRQFCDDDVISMSTDEYDLPATSTHISAHIETTTTTTTLGALLGNHLQERDIDRL